MNPRLSCTPLIKVLSSEPLAKLGPAQSYWIRVVPDKRSTDALYAIAAVRCENREELHWLSAGMPTPAMAVKLMRTGFVPEAANDLSCDIVEELLKNGSSAWLEVEAIAAA